MRSYISVDQTTAVLAGAAAQVFAYSQTFPLTKSKRRFLFASASLGDPDFKLSLAYTDGKYWPICPFIGIAFNDANGAALDFLWLGTEIHYTQNNNNQFLVLDVANAGIKWAAQSAGMQEFFYSGRGGYPPGTVTMQLAAAISVLNSDAVLPHNAIVRLRAIMEETAE
jgi:hypothetical protein